MPWCRRWLCLAHLVSPAWKSGAVCHLAQLHGISSSPHIEQVIWRRKRRSLHCSLCTAAGESASLRPSLRLVPWLPTCCDSAAVIKSWCVARGRFLPDATQIVGYARSNLTDADLHQRLKPYLKGSDKVVDEFLSSITYVQGNPASCRLLFAAILLRAAIVTSPCKALCVCFEHLIRVSGSV